MAEDNATTPNQPKTPANQTGQVIPPRAAAASPSKAPATGSPPTARAIPVAKPVPSAQAPAGSLAQPLAPRDQSGAVAQVAKARAVAPATPGQVPSAKPAAPRAASPTSASPQQPQAQVPRQPAPAANPGATAVPGAQVPARPASARSATTPAQQPAKTQPAKPTATSKPTAAPPAATVPPADTVKASAATNPAATAKPQPTAKPPAAASSVPVANAPVAKAQPLQPPRRPAEAPSSAPATVKPTAPAVHVASGTTLDELFALSIPSAASPLPQAELVDLASPLATAPGSIAAASVKTQGINWGRYALIAVLICVCTGTGLYLFDKYVVQPGEYLARKNPPPRTPLTPEQIAERQAKAKQAQEKFAAEQTKRQEEQNKQLAAQQARRKALEDQKAVMVKNVEPSIVLITIKDETGTELGLGSGFLIDDKGRIATNYHVIEHAWTADATFSTGNKKKIIGSILLDEDRDLAVLQLEPDAQPYKPLTLANDEPERTDPVIAFGHPQGFQFTTSTGTVTAMYRTDQLPEQYRDGMSAPADNMWIQTDTRISGGNSGGPLLNLQGQVIGINTWIGKDRPDMRFATSIENLQELLKKAPKQHVALEKTTGQTGKVTQIYATYANSLEWFERQLREAKSRSELIELVENNSPIPEHAPRLLPYITNHSKTPAQWLALRAYLSMARQFHFPAKCDADLAKVLEIASRDYPDPKRQMDLLFILMACRREPAQKYLDTLAKNKASPEVSAFANFCIAERIADRADGDMTKLDEAVTYLQRIVKEFPYAKVPRIGNLAQLANRRIHELTYLEVGRTAQEIEGDDALGTEFKLSDYRGKAVILFFWADWCPYCKKMYPQLRELVTKYEKEPLVLLGVNCDQSSSRLQALEERKIVTWKNWFNGPDGDITADWQISGYPTVILLDGKGVIRHVKVSPEELEEQAVALVTEITGKSAGKKELPAWLHALGKKKAETSEAPKE